MAHGQPTHDMAPIDDSAQRALEDALARAEAELRQARRLDALGRVAGSIAHDLNNLLMVVNFQAERLERELGPAHEATRELMGATEKASALVDRLLALRAREEVDVTRVDVNLRARRVLESLAPRIPESIDVRWELDAALGRTVADPAHIDQIVQHLVINALDAMPGGGTLTIATSHVRAQDAHRIGEVPGLGAWVLLEVRDTGEGMDAPTRERALEPFVTTRDDGTHDGLGLSAVEALVRQWHGSLRLHSVPGDGTSACVFLPRSRDEATRPTRTPVVLVVDREQAVRRMIRDSLAGRGYDVVDAPDVGAALAAAERPGVHIDLLLIDALIARRDSSALAERLTRGSPRCATVTMTSGGTNGFTGPTLRKPFTVSSLFASIDAACGRAPTRERDAG